MPNSINTLPARLRFGTRGSALALRQTQEVQERLTAAWPTLLLETIPISTQGDRVLELPLPLIGGKGVFTGELEAALYSGAIDCAVHSLKDLPTLPPEGLEIGAIPLRAAPHDVLISRDGYTLATLPAGATVGTSSLRRAAQLLHTRPDLRPTNIRGNVDTRIRKAMDPAGGYDAIVLAQAGIERLGLLDMVGEVIPLEIMLPAPGQGAIAVQARAGDAVLDLLRAIHHPASALAVTAERVFLSALGGGCAVPVAACGQVEGATLLLRGRVSAVDGTRQIDVDGQIAVGEGAAEALGERLAAEALRSGADMLLGQAAP